MGITQSLSAMELCPIEAEYTARSRGGLTRLARMPVSTGFHARMVGILDSARPDISSF